jgi:hypothetical protein
VVEKLAQIEAEIQAPPMENLEESSGVCQRLGIDAETHRTLLQAMLGDMREWTIQLRANPTPPELEKLLVRANGLKGACLSLGAVRAAQHLVGLQSALPFPADQPSPALESLEREIAALSEQLGVPAAA